MTTTRRRRPELAAFLRSRRARVTPGDVGMPPGLRRRTPGLRREEVAQLSGVGVTWYTWLEQGRPINASPQVLDAVARTLRLDQPEREHLYHLAGVAWAPDPSAAQDRPQTVGPEVQAVIEALVPLPAVVYNARYDILAGNAAFRDLFFSARPAPGGARNAVWSLFTQPDMECAMVQRDRQLPTLVARLRAAYGRHVGEPFWEDFIRALCRASEEFRGLWESRDVAPAGPLVKVYRHASLGELRMRTISLSIDGMPECRIVTYHPSDEATEHRLRILDGRRRRASGRPGSRPPSDAPEPAPVNGAQPGIA